jgi:ADP-L-glycero-D-manno-heptose 6-epimerase
MIVVTGGAGFIGSNIIKKLNQRGRTDIIVVDNLTNGQKIHNLADLDIIDYVDKDTFYEKIGKTNTDISAIIHQGACSSTTEWNGKYIMDNNYKYSVKLLNYCQEKQIPFIYASSASVYGLGKNGFRVSRECERPINAYAYSKFQFDQYVRQTLPLARSPIVGLRYFNVYGLREQHKENMCSPIYHFYNQLKQSNTIKLFGEYDGIAAGEQKRDFIHVYDVVDINLWFLKNNHSGIFNVGTGIAESFNDVAEHVYKWNGMKGYKTYIDFPEHLKGAYQSYTQADISTLRDIGYLRPFTPISEGIPSYLDDLARKL